MDRTPAPIDRDPQEPQTWLDAMPTIVEAEGRRRTHVPVDRPLECNKTSHGGNRAWAAGDIRARGFLLGTTAGRTTQEGEGLQHKDGHGQVLSSVIASCISYDPAYAYEIAAIVQDGLRRMFQAHEDVFYHLTLVDEKTAHPAMPDGAREGIVKGLYKLRSGTTFDPKPRVQLFGSGAILKEVIAAADLLERDFDVSADVWSATSYTELRRDGIEAERWSLLHPDQPPRMSFVQRQLAHSAGPIVAVTDAMRIVPDQIRPFITGHRFVTLGPDGFGLSEVSRHQIVVAALKALVDDGVLPMQEVLNAIARYEIDTEARSAALA
jgi:pyruvate dehydrogenase E1 component